MKVVGKGTKTLYHVLLISGSVIMLYPFAFAFLGMFMSDLKSGCHKNLLDLVALSQLL